MLDSDLKISQWRQQRKKGLFHFIISHYFLGCLGFLGGKTLERLSFSDDDLDLLFAKELLITFMTLSIIIPLVGLFFWCWNERKYHRHNEKYNSHTTEKKS